MSNNNMNADSGFQRADWAQKNEQQQPNIALPPSYNEAPPPNYDQAAHIPSVPVPGSVQYPAEYPNNMPPQVQQYQQPPVQHQPQFNSNPNIQVGYQAQPYAQPPQNVNYGQPPPPQNQQPYGQPPPQNAQYYGQPPQMQPPNMQPAGSYPNQVQLPAHVANQQQQQFQQQQQQQFQQQQQQQFQQQPQQQIQQQPQSVELQLREDWKYDLFSCCDECCYSFYTACCLSCAIADLRAGLQPENKNLWWRTVGPVILLEVLSALFPAYDPAMNIITWIYCFILTFNVTKALAHRLKITQKASWCRTMWCTCCVMVRNVRELEMDCTETRMLIRDMQNATPCNAQLPSGVRSSHYVNPV